LEPGLGPELEPRLGPDRGRADRARFRSSALVCQGSAEPRHLLWRTLRRWRRQRRPRQPAGKSRGRSRGWLRGRSHGRLRGDLTCRPVALAAQAAYGNRLENSDSFLCASSWTSSAGPRQTRPAATRARHSLHAHSRPPDPIAVPMPSPSTARRPWRSPGAAGGRPADAGPGPAAAPRSRTRAPSTTDAATGPPRRHDTSCTTNKIATAGRSDDSKIAADTPMHSHVLDHAVPSEQDQRHTMALHLAAPNRSPIARSSPSRSSGYRLLSRRSSGQDDQLS
jgi:hypothetical protein